MDARDSYVRRCTHKTGGRRRTPRLQQHALRLFATQYTHSTRRVLRFSRASAVEAAPVPDPTTSLGSSARVRELLSWPHCSHSHVTQSKVEEDISNFRNLGQRRLAFGTSPTYCLNQVLLCLWWPQKRYIHPVRSQHCDASRYSRQQSNATIKCPSSHVKASQMDGC